MGTTIIDLDTELKMKISRIENLKIINGRKQFEKNKLYK